MAKYLDPKADVTFKKVFGERKNLVTSLLSAMLPLAEGKQIEKIEYLPSEIAPRTPLSDGFWDQVRRNAALMDKLKETHARLDVATAERDAEKTRADAAVGKLRQTARNLKTMNLTNVQIAAATGLTAGEIAEL